MDLYIERGYRETLIEDITNGADVSRRTFFRLIPPFDIRLCRFQL